MKLLTKQNWNKQFIQGGWRGDQNNLFTNRCTLSSHAAHCIIWEER